MPRILAIDYGQKRTELWLLMKCKLLLLTNNSALVTAIALIIFERKVEAVLIGEPKQMNGLPSESALDNQRFCYSFYQSFSRDEGNSRR
jgi:putative Holliday junction resolvase